MNEFPQPEMFDKDFDRKPDIPAMFQNAAEYRDFVLSLLFLKLPSAFNCYPNESSGIKTNKVKVQKDVAVAICGLCWPNAVDWSDEQIAEKLEEIVYRWTYGQLTIEDSPLAEELWRLTGRYDEIEIVDTESG